MPLPVKQELLDFVMCQFDREESERARRLNQELIEGRKEADRELEKTMLKCKEKAQRKWEVYQRECLVKEQEFYKKMRELIREGEEKAAEEERTLLGRVELIKKHIRTLEIEREQEEHEAERIRKKSEEDRKNAELAELARIEQQRRQLEMKQKEEQEKIKKEKERLAEEKKKKDNIKSLEDQLKKQQAIQQQATSSKLVGDFNRVASESALKEAAKYEEHITRIKTHLSKKGTNISKDHSYQVRKNVIASFNTITDHKNDVIRSATELCKILSDSKINQYLYHYALKVISKKFIKYAEIDSKMIFNLAHVAVLVSSQAPELVEQYLMPIMYKNCCYILPRYYNRQNVSEAYKKQIGYKISKDADDQYVESDESYITRMCNIAGLYFAIMQTDPLFPNIEKPIPITDGFKWISRIMNLVPRPITPSLVYTCLTIIPVEVHKHFKHDAYTLFSSIYRHYFLNPVQEFIDLKNTAPAALSRLNTLMDEAAKNKFMFPEHKLKYLKD
ncbi:9566_t:CDS:2 [Entrophospora sp. SA101]|nr:9566_t:CDS:2 [Entrophospora sp. SA101]CAJ0894072.1 17362_t:CDS:2 [Entrophospora sp. SA101]